MLKREKSNPIFPIHIMYKQFNQISHLGLGRCTVRRDVGQPESQWLRSDERRATILRSQ